MEVLLVTLIMALISKDVQDEDVMVLKKILFNLDSILK